MDSGAGHSEAPRVVYLARSADEVVRRYLGRLRRLQDEGFEVHVLAGDGPGIDELVGAGIDAEPIPVASPHNVAGLIGAYFIIQARLLELRPLLVHTFGHRVAWIGAFAAEQAEVPVTFATMEFHWLEEEPLRVPLGPLAMLSNGTPGSVQEAEEAINQLVGSPYRRTMHRAYRWLADRVDRYLVTTEFDFQLLQDMEVVDADKLEMIIGGAGVDLDEYAIEQEGHVDREGARRRLGLPDQWRQVVGWVGPVTRRHGADDLTAAISKLQMTHPSVGWIVAPRGELADGQRRLLERFEQRDRIRLFEDFESGADLYRAMDMLAWMGRASTPHDAIGEAAALAVPTVGYETPGARSLVEQGQTGHLVFEGDREAAIGTIAKLLNDPKYLEDLGWRARSRATGRLARRAVDDQVVRLYDLVLDQVLSGGVG